MELLVKCTALAVFSALIALMIRRMNPELSFAVAALAVVVLLLSCTSLMDELVHAFLDTQQLFGSAMVQARPILKCLGIAIISKFGADLCRDASQSALAAVVETAGKLCAAAVAMPMILSLMTTIGGML